MDPRPAQSTIRALTEQAGLARPHRRRTLQTWSLSHVERITLSDDSTIICKTARAPFTSEARTLRALSASTVPVPRVLAEAHFGGSLVMLLEDLGESDVIACDRDGAIAAAALHRAGAEPAGLARLDTAALAALPETMLVAVRTLCTDGRLHLEAPTEPILEDLVAARHRLSRGAELPPFGLSHGELHPSSLHVTGTNRYLLDFGMAFIGPGLLDLATWQGTRQPPDPTRLSRQMAFYTAAGGHPLLHHQRGGLPACIWALGWHRLHSAAWLLDLLVTGSTAFANASQIVCRQILGAGQLLL